MPPIFTKVLVDFALPAILAIAREFICRKSPKKPTVRS
jgi:hypothetical protein